MAADPNMRVSDNDRESAAASLREHFAQGRLTNDELNERLDRIFAAKTRADLDAVVADLPFQGSRGPYPADGIGGGGYRQPFQNWAGPGGSAQGSGPGEYGPPFRNWGGPASGPGGYGPNGGPQWGRPGYSSYGSGGRGPRGGSALRLIPVLVAVLVVLVLVNTMGLAGGPGVIIAIALGAWAIVRWIFGFGRRRGRGGRCGRR